MHWQVKTVLCNGFSSGSKPSLHHCSGLTPVWPDKTKDMPQSCHLGRKQLQLSGMRPILWVALWVFTLGKKCWQHTGLSVGAELFPSFILSCLYFICFIPSWSDSDNEQKWFNLINHLIKCHFPHSSLKSCPVGRSWWTVLSLSCLCLNVSSHNFFF